MSANFWMLVFLLKARITSLVFFFFCRRTFCGSFGCACEYCTTSTILPASRILRVAFAIGQTSLDDLALAAWARAWVY
jgi:hypothetical protein